MDARDLRSRTLICGKDDITTYTFNTGVAKHTILQDRNHMLRR